MNSRKNNNRRESIKQSKKTKQLAIWFLLTVLAFTLAIVWDRSTHPETNVAFDSDARPLFDFVEQVTVNYANSRSKDVRLANRALKELRIKHGEQKVLIKDIRAWIRENNLVWHHDRNEIMQLVNKEIHSQTAHSGGFSR